MSPALALLASVLWGVCDTLGGSLSRRLTTIAVLAVSQSVAAVGLLAYVLLVSGPRLTQPADLYPAIAAGICWMLGLAAFYRALALGTMGVVAPVASAGAVVPVAIGVAAGERPSVLQAVGVAVAIIGVVLCGGPSRNGDGHPRHLRDLQLAVVAAVCFGAELVLLDRTSASTDALLSLVPVRLTAWSLVMAVMAVQRLRHARRRAAAAPVPASETGARVPVLALVALGVLDLLAMAAYVVAGRSGALSVVAVLASLSPAVTVLLARWVHRERLQHVQQWGVLASVGGAALMAV